MKRIARWFTDPVALGGIAVFLVSQVVYILTLTRSCPFWDSGEFIATSYTLGIPHPPGTPLYVLIGRIFSLLPIGSIATRVNYLSAFASSLAVLFTYLVVVDFARRWVREREAALDRWIAIGGGIVAAFFLAFSRTFWDNAIEAEVYALSNFVMVFCVWLMLKWEASGTGEQRNHNYLLLIGYVLFAAIGIHMGVFLVGPPLFLYLLVIAPRTFFNRDVLLGAAVVLGALILFALVRAAGGAVGLGLMLAMLLYLALLVSSWKRLARRNLVSWLVGLAVLGLSVHLFLIIRARLDPMINEADPSTWENLWLVLSRDQYKPPNPFLKRQATWAVQFTKHFWRYWQDQYHLGLRPEWFAMALPYGIGLVGAVTQFMRDRKRFLLMLALVFMTSVFLVFYLNFKEDEVRNRDYFFVAGYHFFALWIGLGAVAIARWLRGEVRQEGAQWREAPGGRFFGLGAVAILVVVSLLPMAHGWYTHDRTDFTIAREYAYNMLVALEPNAVIFTNGDNDTFPLWYLQEVEGIRTDVRVVNLSLLNTQWYIRQIRDYEPRVRVTLSEEEIDRLHGVMLPDGRVVLVKDIMVHHILDVNPQRPIYVAVTVPELMELDEHMVMEGLVFRYDEEEGEPERVDAQKTWHNLEEVYLFDGLLDEEGFYDESVYKDPNARKLVQNYVAAYVKLAHNALSQNNEDEAMRALEKARRINPDFAGVLYTLGYLWMNQGAYDRAEEAFRDMIDAGDRSSDAFRLYGAALEAQQRYSEAEAAYREAVRRHPEEFDNYRILFTLLWQLDQRPAAVAVIESWLARHPEDEATRAALRQLLADSSAAAPADGGRLEEEAPAAVPEAAPVPAPSGAEGR